MNMKLSIDKIREITTGAVRVYEENGNIELCRFSEDESEFYKQRSADYYMKSGASSGMRFCFKTNSETLSISADMSLGSSRKYFSFDVFVGDECIGHLDNFSDIEIPPMFSTLKVPLGEAHKTFMLGKGEKTVTVYLPWSAKTTIKEISVDDGSYVEALKRDKKLLAYGDSITQGYDALRPSNRYIARLCDALGFEETNKAIGGEVFCPALASFENETPDLITVSYGTNDWNTGTVEKFKERSRGFFENLRRNYPDTKIFAITPIWRKDTTIERKFGEFRSVADYIREAAEGLDIQVIYGYDLVPEDEMLFGDLRLHPNDEGFKYYADNLLKKIKS